MGRVRAPLLAWAPAAILAAGALLTLGSSTQPGLALRVPLGAAVPDQIAGYKGVDLALSAEERQVAGVADYLLRSYAAAASGPGPAGFSLYVGYYDRQTEGHTIHSPKNCLPGAGWEPLRSQTALIPAPGGPVTVNRYLLHNGSQRALVLYWYQGRGRIASNEYLVKWDLLRDSALRRRSDEALTRLVFPVTDSEDLTFSSAVQVARVIIPALARALPS